MTSKAADFARPDSLPASGPGSRGLAAVLATALLVLATLLRLPGIGVSLTVDEAWTIHVIRAEKFWTVLRQDVHPPVFYALLRPLAGHSPDAFTTLRLITLACGVALPVLAVVWLRRQPLAALLTGMTAAVLPGLVAYSPQLRPYSFLLLAQAAALALAIRIHRGDRRAATCGLLAVLLVIAAATHLITLFYLVALLPLLWPDRPLALPHAARTVWPLVPAALTALAFKFCFIIPPQSVAGGGWLRGDLAGCLDAGRSALGWPEIDWLADAWSRHAPGGTLPILLLAFASAATALGIAWLRQPGADPLGHLLLLGAALYVAGTFTYAQFFEPIIQPRTLFPALLPFFTGLAWAISTHPVRAYRLVATAAGVTYLLLAAVPVVRLGFVTAPGLREFAGTLNRSARPGDLVVQLRTMDYALPAYQAPPPAVTRLLINETTASPADFTALATHLAALAPDARVLLAYRDDHYHRAFQGVYEHLAAEVTRRRGPLREVYRTEELILLSTGGDRPLDR